MIKISENIFKFKAHSNVYLLLKEKVLIDAGHFDYKDSLRKELSEIIPLDEIKFVIFTHFHYDHISNFDLFNNAQFFASKEEISYYKKNPFGAILNEEVVKKFESVLLYPIEDFPEIFEDLIFINTPGHTKGSICLFYNHEVLFSGDTLFNNGHGRIDLPSAVPDMMDDSLERISKLKYKILCAGHDY